MIDQKVKEKPEELIRAEKLENRKLL